MASFFQVLEDEVGGLLGDILCGLLLPDGHNLDVISQDCYLQVSVVSHHLINGCHEDQSHEHISKAITRNNGPGCSGKGGDTPLHFNCPGHSVGLEEPLQQGDGELVLPGLLNQICMIHQLIGLHEVEEDACNGLIGVGCKLCQEGLFPGTCQGRPAWPTIEVWSIVVPEPPASILPPQQLGQKP